MRLSDFTIGAPIERLGTKCPSITSMCIRSAPACSASRTCSPRRAKSAARIDGAILAFVSSDASCGTGVFLERIHKLLVAVRNLLDRVFPGDLFCPPIHQRIPETRAADRETNEPGDAGRRRQPLVHLLVVLAPA